MRSFSAVAHFRRRRLEPIYIITELYPASQTEESESLNAPQPEVSWTSDNF